MTNASDILYKLWSTYMDEVEIPRIKVLLAIKKKWAEYKMTVFVFPVNLHAFYTEIEGYAGGTNATATSVFNKFIVNKDSEGIKNEVFVEKYLNRKFKEHIVSVEPHFMKASEDDNVQVANLGYVVTFKRIEDIDVSELLVEPTED